MKKLITTAIVSFILIGQSVAANLQFAWEQDPVPSDFGGWYLYMSQTSGGSYNQVATFDFTEEQASYSDQFTLDTSAVDEQNFYFVLTAFDNTGNESPFSNEVKYRFDEVPPQAPTSVTVELIISQ